jgi:tetratricopeptide (TPR) repeat protein
LLDARLSPDGLQLMGAANDGTIKVWDGRTLTDDLTTNRETRGLIEVLFQRAVSEREMVERIRVDKTIGEAVRRSALEMVRSYVHRLAHCEACARLDALFAEPLFREEVRDSIRGNCTMPPLVQQLALALVENYPENAEALKRAAYHVLRADCDATSYRRCVQHAKRLCELVPSCTEYRDLLGIARYRTGDYTGAVEILGSPKQLDLKPDAFLAARNLCFLAMAQQRLRRSQEARATLARAKLVAAQPMDTSQQGEARLLMAEADAVISHLPESGLPAR